MRPKTKPNAFAARATYYTYAHNIDSALRNGSFLRVSEKGIAQFMNGDFMGFIDSIDVEKYAKVETEKALRLLPKCCVGG